MAITKVSDITTSYLANYLRIIEPTSDQLDELATFLTAAKSYVSSYTGLPISLEAGEEGDTLDTYPEITIAVCVLVQNQYDNRTFYTDKGRVEEVVSSILGMHRRNLL